MQEETRHHTREKSLFRVPGHLEQVPHCEACMEPQEPSVAKGLLVHMKIDSSRMTRSRQDVLDGLLCHG